MDRGLAEIHQIIFASADPGGFTAKLISAALLLKKTRESHMARPLADKPVRRPASMNELQIFENPEFGKVRTIVVDGEPWLVGKDVATALGYNDTDQALRRHIDEDDKLTRQIDGSGQNRSMTIINESGLYSLVLSSKIPTAKKFKRWVTSEVLPTIRKTGGYVNSEDLFLNTYLPGVDENVKTLFKLTLGQLREANGRVKALEEDARHLCMEIAHMEPKAAYFDACVERTMLTTLRETAKLYGVGEKQFVRWLMDNRYLYRSGSGKLLPYATRPSGELFAVKEFFDPKTRHGGVTTYVTPRGRETFRLLLDGGTESRLWWGLGGPHKEAPREMTARDAELAEESYRKRGKKKRA